MQAFTFWTIVNPTNDEEYTPIQYDEGYPSNFRQLFAYQQLQRIQKHHSRESAVAELVELKRMFPDEHKYAGVAEMTVEMTCVEIPQDNELVNAKFEKIISKLSKEEQEFIRSILPE